MAEKKKKSHSSFGTLFWIAFILLIIILFVYNKDSIFSGISKIGGSGVFPGKKKVELNGNSAEPITPKVTTNEISPTTQTGSEPKGDGSLGPVPQDGKPEQNQNADAIKTVTQPEPTPIKSADGIASGESPAPAEQPQGSAKTGTTAVADQKLKPADADKKPSPKPTARTKTVKPVAKPAEKPPRGRIAKLYFVNIDEDGKVIRKEVTREIPQNDSPLSETLQALFRGPNAAESKKKLISCIPPGTKLLSATVRNGVATINVSEEFQFNQYGIDGSLGQLAQIVFTATAFPTVQSVQFLIDGQRRDYLGAEGVWIGSPLTRAKFN